MTNKRCLLFETLGKVSDLKIVEGKSNDGLMRLSGIFGVCGVKNNNNRIYDKNNYAQMVESLQQVIKESGCPGELEHPNSMNINLENVSHKIEDIQMNEDGTITGTIVLLNTPKGQIAQAIVEGGLPLYISSRAAGTMTNESGISHVTLSTIKTYDLVGTPGFSQAKLSLKQNQTLECLNESVEDGNVIYAIVEGDDLLDDDENSDNKDTKDNKEKTDDKKSEEKSKESEEKAKESEEKSKDDKKDEEKSSKEKESKEDKKDNKNNDNDIDMKDLKQAIDKLTDQVTSLEAELHVVKESVKETKSLIPSINYDAIEEWVTEEYGKTIKDQIETSVFKSSSDIRKEMENKLNESVSKLTESIKDWTVNEFAPEVQNWIAEEYSPNIQEWITEEFAPEVQGWVTEEFAPKVQSWITEEFAPEVQGWITEEFAPVIDNWINEEVTPEINNNISEFMESYKDNRLQEIDSLLESISSTENDDLKEIVKENTTDDKFKGVYVVENMPAEYLPSWQLLSEERKNEIVRTSKMYDFTKDGVLESFWSNVNFSQEKSTIVESSNNNSFSNYYSNIAKQMRHLTNTNF